MQASLPWPEGLVVPSMPLTPKALQAAGGRLVVRGQWHGVPALIKLALADAEVSLRHEWRTLLGLAHPALPTAMAFVDARPDAPAMLVLRLEPGETWETQLASWTEDELLAALDGALGALDPLHSHGVCHADLHAGNLLVANAATRLLDLGLAATAGTPAAGPGLPAVAAPQRLRGEPVSPADDVFSLAATVWTARTGQAPFVGYPAVLPAADATPTPPLPDRLSPPLAVLLVRWLSPASSHRPQDARAARAELAALRTHTVASDPRPESLAQSLEASAARPLRFGAWGAVVPAEPRVVARSEAEALQWLHERASRHAGPVGWLNVQNGEVRCWPLGIADATAAPSDLPIGDPQGAAVVACRAQLTAWLAALGPQAALAVAAPERLPGAWQRALDAALAAGATLWLAAADGVTRADAPLLPALSAAEVLLALRAISGCSVSDGVVRAVLLAKLQRHQLGPVVAGWLRAGTLAVQGGALVTTVEPAEFPVPDLPARAAPVQSWPDDAEGWLALLLRATQTATLEWVEPALVGWLQQHAPVGPLAAPLRCTWLQARAALGSPLPTFDNALQAWLALPLAADDAIALAAMAFTQGDYPAAKAHAVVAAEHAVKPEQRHVARRWQAFALTWAGERGAATALVAELATEQPADLAVCYLQALLAYYAGDLSAAHNGFAALATRMESKPALAAAALTGLGLVAHRNADLANARTHYAAARAQALACGDRLRALNMQMNLAVLDHEAGALAEALQRYDQAAAEATALANQGAALRVQLNRANLLIVLGMDEQAAAEITAVLPLLESGSWQLLLWNAQQMLAEVARRSGWLARAATHLSRAEAALQATGAQTERWELQLEQVQLLAAQGHTERAQAELAALREVVDKPEWQARWIQQEVGLALLDPAGRSPQRLAWARERLTAAAALAPDAKPILQSLLALDAAQVALAAGDLSAALALAHDHHARLTRMRASLPAAYRSAFAGSGPLRDAWQWFGWLQSVAPAASLPATRPSGANPLQAILAINRRLSEVRDLPAVLDVVMDAAILLTGAERGFLLLQGELDERSRKRTADADVGNLTVRVARNLDRENLSKPAGRLSHSIACRVVQDDERIVTTDATQDARFAEQASVHSASLRSILCVPMRAQGKPIGCLYVDNRFASGAFSTEHVALLEALADQAAIALTTAALVQRLQASVAAQAEQQQAIADLNAQLQARLDAAEDALDSARADLSAQRLEVQRRSDFAAIKGESPKLHQLFAVMERVREHDFAVLVRGESGTGKELVARAMHYTGKRKRGPFVAINCGALPSNLLESELFGHARGAFTGATHDRRGLFEAAHGGTLLLDEVGEMPPDMQVKLLRVLQSGELLRVGEQTPRKVDVRVIAATHRDLQAMVHKGLFREDLLYRLRVIELMIPPLRERTEDLPLLVEHFLRENRRAGLGKVERLTPRALQLLAQYPFPGNVRQLETILKSACVFAEQEVLDAGDLAAVLPRDLDARKPDALAAGATAQSALLTTQGTLFAVEGAVIRERLAQFGGNKRKTAESLGIDRGTLYNRLRAHNLTDGAS